MLPLFQEVLEMALIELKTIEIEKLFTLDMKIPNYQRPYSWSEKSINALFDDLDNACKDCKEYRLGTVIFHKDKDKNNIYNIIDGQQRLTTLAILLYCLGERDNKLLSSKYPSSSHKNIRVAYNLLADRLKKSDGDKLKDYILSKCTVVKVVTDKEQEAFQFFDTQNSRGKDLAPHDVLKAHHLREMKDMEEKKTIDIITQWESIEDTDLSDLFKSYLFPITQWSKGNRALNKCSYTKNHIGTFTGIRKDEKYNYLRYHIKCKGKHRECKEYHQLTQPIIAGEGFFSYTFCYNNLLKEIRKYNKYPIPETGPGDLYVKRLYECALLFFVDRFNLDELNEFIGIIYAWCYSLRLKSKSLGEKSVDKHALGKGGVLSFEKLSEMTQPSALEDLKESLTKVKKDGKENDIIEEYKKNPEGKYMAIADKIEEIIGKSDGKK